IWANYIRGKYFSAGNTTTNRIESNSNQVKLLLGKRPRLDATISGLLAHQGTIIRRREACAIPDFLTRVSARLSDNPLSKVRSQWDHFMVYLVDTNHHLPCQHLMFIADHVHRFEYLPESAVPQRWDMVAMSELDKELRGGVGALQVV
ncbi:hypothetical protein PHYSODRAFT_525110, partial [Phytophthora sojae]